MTVSRKVQPRKVVSQSRETVDDEKGDGNDPLYLEVIKNCPYFFWEEVKIKKPAISQRNFLVNYAGHKGMIEYSYLGSLIALFI